MATSARRKDNLNSRTLRERHRTGRSSLDGEGPPVSGIRRARPQAVSRRRHLGPLHGAWRCIGCEPVSKRSSNLGSRSKAARGQAPGRKSSSEHITELGNECCGGGRVALLLLLGRRALEEVRAIVDSTTSSFVPASTRPASVRPPRLQLPARPPSQGARLEETRLDTADTTTYHLKQGSYPLQLYPRNLLLT